MKKIDYFTILCIFISMLAINACSREIPTDLTDKEPTASSDPTSLSRISTQLAASSFQELAYYSDIVVIGQIISKEQIINTARDPSNPTKPDPRFFSINQVYSVKVDSILEGESKNILLLVHNQGLLKTAPDVTPTIAEIESEIDRNIQKTFIPLSLDTRYIFFLKILDKISYDLNGYKSTELYAGVAEPWRFKITSDDLVVPETLFPDMDMCFPRISVKEVGVLVETSSDTYSRQDAHPCKDPYPLPLTITTDPSDIQTPYP